MGVLEGLPGHFKEWFGLTVPPGHLAWAARKTEIVSGSGQTRSQAYHCLQFLTNGYLAIPGKLSQAAAATSSLRHARDEDERITIDRRPPWCTPPRRGTV